MNIEELPKDALVLILDADSISYVIAHKLKGEVDMKLADLKIDVFVRQLYQQVGASHVAAFLKGKGNFRYEVAKTKSYKGTRKSMSEEDCRWQQYINQFLVDNYQFQRVDGIEADDAVSITTQQLRKKGINHLICSNDKDIDQVWGNHYSMNKRQFYHINKEQASLLLHRQYITGDATDNIPGLPGKGKVYAEKLIREDNVEEHWNNVKWAYQNTLKELMPPAVNSYLKEQISLLTLLPNHPSFLPEFHLIDKEQEIPTEDPLAFL